MSKSHIFLPIMAVVLFIILLWSFGFSSYFNIDTLRENQLFLKNHVANNFLSTFAIYFLLYCAIVGFSIPIATLMTLVGGFLFGQTIGTIAVVTAASLGGCIIFSGVRLVSKNITNKRLGKWIKQMQQGFAENAFLYMLTVRLIPIFPFVIVNLVAGILQIRFRDFFLGTLLGIIPSSFIYVSIGVSLQELLARPDFSLYGLLEPRFFLALTALGILALLPVIYRKRRKADASED
ncbi:MAG: hypothetical protein COA94_01980 [Rickettsiales bacterium]|nr:MAG: hypothetical protein COA94_01980 [Rickettsiales bacterium]